MAELLSLRCLDDNYAYLIHGGGETVLIDAPEAAPVLAALAGRGWGLDRIFLTHHHSDHIQAVPEIVAATGARVAGNRADAHRLPPLDQPLDPGDRPVICGEPAEVIDVPGHTIGHIALYVPAAHAVFTADSLMAMGCGRLFEGSAAQMWPSLSRLAALPPDTLVCSGHDYTASNGAFARSVEPDNSDLAARVADTLAGRRPAAPATLADELATNPFLRLSHIAPALGLAGAPDAEVFARLRAMKDAFRG